MFRVLSLPVGRPVILRLALVSLRRHARGALLSGLLAAALHPVSAHASERDTVVIDVPMITVAGKSERAQSAAAVASTVVGAREMERMGAMTLSDVLAEQTGLGIVNDHGTGVQLQGLSPEYTLILIDGEPAVGRTAGTLELDRFMIGGLDQVEIVKGPSSSLYGSEAMGGVINLVTRSPIKPFSASVYTRYGTNQTLKTGAGVEARQGTTGLSLFADRTSSTGYDLSPESRSQTAPAYRAYTLQPKIVHAYADDSRLTISGRSYQETQRNAAMFQYANDSTPARERAAQTDLGLNASLEHRMSPTLDWTAKAYTTLYRTRMSVRLDSAGTPDDDSLVSSATFDQRYHKAETFLTVRHAEGFTTITGGGGAWETVHADRVEGGERAAYSGFLFAQEEYARGSFLNLQASARVDAHRDYATTFSPRIAAMVRPLPWLAVRASAGKGFKAPTFQQLYMDFTNPTVGYSVFGSHGVSDAVDQLEAQGFIAERLQPLSDQALKPEHSVAFNGGLEATVGGVFTARGNAFYNTVRDLIDTRPVARKTNGQNVHSYFNLKRIHTWGFENELSYQPWKSLKVESGYQFLIARDDDVLDSIRAGRIFKVGSTGVVRPVQLVEYGGLFNRSRHTGSVKATWDTDIAGAGFSTSIRGLMRGRYGYADRNGNGILDADNEYEPGYTLWNLSMAVRPVKTVALEARLDNLFDVTRPLVPLPGRLFYAGIRVQTF